MSDPEPGRRLEVERMIAEIEATQERIIAELAAFREEAVAKLDTMIATCDAIRDDLRRHRERHHD